MVIRPSFAIFDLDHTLIPFETQALFCNFVLKREPWRVALHLVFAPFAVARAFRLTSSRIARRALHAYLWRMPAGRLRAYAREFAQTSARRWTYPELLTEIARHRDEGRTLVLNTASPDFFVTEIAAALGFEHCVATQFEIGERFPLMPRLPAGENMTGRKVTAMLAQIPAMAALTPGERAGCWCYSDSTADLPLLRLVGHAVVVHPWPGLAAIAHERGWPVLMPVRPYRTRAGDALRACLQFFGLHAE